jgi:hypothetical protein
MERALFGTVCIEGGFWCASDLPPFPEDGQDADKDDSDGDEKEVFLDPFYFSEKVSGE